MATNHVSSPSKTEVYQSLYLICQATQQITDNLERLKAARVLKPCLRRNQQDRSPAITG